MQRGFTSRLLPRLSALVGPRSVLPSGALVVAACGIFFAVLHTR